MLHFLDNGPWEIVTPRISTPWNLACIDVGSRTIKYDNDVEYGTYELIYGGKDLLNPAGSQRNVLIALSIIRGQSIVERTASNGWEGDFEITERYLKSALNSESLLFNSLFCFFERGNENIVSQAIDQEIQSIVNSLDATKVSLIALGRNEDSTMRVAYGSHHKDGPVETNAVLLSENHPYESMRRTYDGGEVWVNCPRTESVPISSYPVDIEPSSPGLVLLSMGNVSVVEENVTSFFREFGISWGTGNYVIEDNDQRHVYTIYNVLEDLLNNGTRISDSGTEFFKLRDCLNGEININGDNIHFHEVRDEQGEVVDYNQGHIDSKLPGLFIVSVARGRMISSNTSLSI